MRFAATARKDIERWVAKGIIDNNLASRLKDELATQASGFGIGGVLAILGSLLLGAAILTVIASNWESVPRLVRVAFVFSIIWFGYFCGAWRERKGDEIFSQVLYLLAATAFGGGIALIGQMYHLSGDAAAAALVWTVGTLAGAFALQSFALSAMAGGVGLSYLAAALMENSWHSSGFLWVAPLLAVAVAILSHWNNSRLGIHTAMWLLLGTVICYRFSSFSDTFNQLDFLFAFGGAALFFLISFNEDAVERITAFSHPLLTYTLAHSFFGFGILQVLYDGDSSFTALIGLVVIALSVAALLLKGKDHGAVRALAYSAFGAQILYLASVTIGSILGTSVFFLFAGIIVLFIAFLVIRIERRIKSTPLAENAGA